MQNGQVQKTVAFFDPNSKVFQSLDVVYNLRNGETYTGVYIVFVVNKFGDLEGYADINGKSVHVLFCDAKFSNSFWYGCF
jgi:hypothetical protein